MVLSIAASANHVLIAKTPLKKPESPIQLNTILTKLDDNTIPIIAHQGIKRKSEGKLSL
jgi:hypothetical protein